MPTNPWPSSDWVGFLVEWGPAGLVLLALALGSLGLRGMQGALGANAAEARLQAIALVSTVTALAVVGAVDSVLHLATPNFLFWAAAGALAPAARPWKTFRPGTGAKAFLFVAFLALAGALTVRSAAQVGAIVVAGHGWRIADLETASFLDPGSYRLHMLLAERWTRQGRCDRARPHAEAALRLFPNLPAPKRLMATCGKPAATNSGSP